MRLLKDGGRCWSPVSALKALWISLPIAKTLPLSILILRFRPLNLLTAVISVALATATILCQWGFRDALFESSVSMQELFDADVVMIHRASVSTLTWMSSFPMDFIDEFRGDPRVKSAGEVRIAYMRWSFSGDPSERLLTAVGVNTGEPELYRHDLATHLDLINLPGQILFDRQSRPEYGNINSIINDDKSVYGMLESQRVKVAGTIYVGSSFGADAAAVMSRETFESILPAAASGDVELGLIKLKDPKMQKEFLSSYDLDLPPNVLLITPSSLAKMEMRFWDQSKPIGFVFLVGVSMSLLIGATVLFLILNTIVLLHQGDFATLMALGYSRSRLQQSIFNQAVFMCLAGYPVGYLIAEIIYGLTGRVTSLHLSANVFRSSLTLSFIFVSSCISGLLAMRRLKEANPSDAFG